MVGVDPTESVHRLNMRTNAKPIKQKQRRFALDMNKIINDEVDRLLTNGMIREVRYLNWISNIALVEKKNEKLRVYIDFTNLNKACPKDSFSVPKIDQMIDATVGFERLTFLNAYSGYN